MGPTLRSPVTIAYEDSAQLAVGFASRFDINEFSRRAAEFVDATTGIGSSRGSRALIV